MSSKKRRSSPVMMQTNSRVLILSTWLVCLTLILIAIGLSVGSSGVENIWHIFNSSTNSNSNTNADLALKQIIWDIRAPRTLGALFAGALLGLAGAVAQGLFRNPLADPFLLGSASGASLGVAVALAAFGISPFATQWAVRLGLTGAAFVGAVAAVFLTLALARGVQHTLRLLLAGVVVGVVLGAIGSLIALMSPSILASMQSFMLGSTSFVDWSACAVMGGVLLLCLWLAWLLARVLDGLALGEETALSLGLPLSNIRMVLVAVIALATGTAVAQTGLIAFVGLAAPHVVRSIVKTAHGNLIVLSTLMGGVLLLLADTLARSLIAPQELPVGVLTAVLGGSYLLWLMRAKTL
jgi:iron complex transport system permease protein